MTNKIHERTFGWIQEASTISNLKNIVNIFVLDSPINKLLRNDKIPRLVSEDYGQKDMLHHLSQKKMCIPYALLKGKGSPKGFTRNDAPCSGIVQAILPGQKKEYQGDWPADSFLRWAISIGFLDYYRNDDCCSLSKLGYDYALSENESTEEKEILTKALLSYPPVCRVLQLLNNEGHLTKFEIGNQLGFVGEAGFTSIPHYMILQGLCDIERSPNKTKERSKFLQNTEGTSDKYVRMICSWLKTMGWITQKPKEITIKYAGIEYSTKINQSYQLKIEGRTVFKYATGSSKFKRIDKRVMWDMLATKAPDREYLRNRRTYILQYLNNTYKTLQEIVLFLQSKKIDTNETCVLDDINGFINIGINIGTNNVSNSYKVMDKIIGLAIPTSMKTITAKSDLTSLKDNIRNQLTHINHKYLALIDLGYDGKADRDYEIQTAALLTTELKFDGGRLGDTRKPDVCIYYNKNGLIIDNKAYGKGYSLPIKQADEMFRYIEENQKRSKKINSNEWWTIFNSTVTNYNFAFVSGEFTGSFKNRINNIYNRSGVKGAVINSVNLLLLAEKIKSGEISYDDSFRYFDCNDEIVIS